ncbi:hypothetical protein [Chryseobacterium indoltheticum]|uniref:hypothetical protein n=1 Tax=Chryseobacterium indoltheticum TaxID=254 RepID=UPI003F4922B4
MAEVRYISLENLDKEILEHPEQFTEWFKIILEEYKHHFKTQPMKKTLLITAILLSIYSFSQKLGTELYENENYSITIPDTWKATNDEGIVNIFPTK